MNIWQLRARAELERRRRGLDSDANPFAKYCYDPALYVIEQLGWHPWAGTPERPGQIEIMQACAQIMRQQHERRDYEHGLLTEDQLTIWQPGETIRNRIRVEAGHGVGKTKAAAGIVSWFFDCFGPAIIYTFAPTYPQINDLLWKEIRADRRRNPRLPGRVLETPEIKHKPNWFAKGRAASNSGGRGTERVQGQHGEYLLFVLDEAEGIPDFVWNAVDSMASGGMSLVLMLANPRTRTSQFYKQRERADVQSFRISCLWHPNVVSDREIVPGAVRRDYVTSMIDDHAEVVQAHEPDNFTFELPWQPGVIYRPDNEFLFRVLGIPPLNSAIDTLIPVGRYEAACARQAQPEPGENTWARMGVDVARWGNDMGTLYVRYNGWVWRARQFAQTDTTAYVAAIRETALWLRQQGVVSIHVRVDAGGGFGGGVVDQLNLDRELAAQFNEWRVWEVDFGGQPYNTKAYYDLVTEMYAEAAEALKRLAIYKPPATLAADLTERKYRWAQRAGTAVKVLEPKDEFRKRLSQSGQPGRSPDDGDGFVMAVAPDYLFRPKKRAGVWGS